MYKPILISMIFICLIGCQNAERPLSNHFSFESETVDDIKLQIDKEKTSEEKVVLNGKLKYLGESEITITHPEPLVSIVIDRDGNGTKVESFTKEVGIQVNMKQNSEYQYDEPIIFDEVKKSSKFYAVARFTSESKKYEIPLSFVLDK